MLTLTTLLDTFAAFYRAGRATQMGTAKPAAYTKHRERAVRSALTLTVEYLSHRFHGGAPTTTVDLEPYVRRLDHWASEAHRLENQLPQSVDTAVSNVRFVVWVVRGWHLGREVKRGPSRPRASFPAWMLSLYDACQASEVHPGFAGALGSLADVLQDHDVKSLAGIPNAYATVSGWLRAAGHGDATRHFILKCYRAGAARHVPPLPALAAVANPDERGLRSLPTIGALIAASETPDLDPRTAGDEALCRAVAPYTHGDMEAHIAAATGVRPAWAGRQWASLSRVLASLIRLGADVAECDLLDLFLESVEAPTVARPRASLTGKRKDRGHLPAHAAMPLVRAALEEGAVQSSANSSLHVQGKPDAAWYTAQVRTDIGSVYRACNVAHADKATTDREKWDRFQSTWQGLEVALKAKPDLAGQPNRDQLSDAVSYPQALLMGVPYLTVEALTVREQVQARPNDNRLARRYEDLLLELHVFVIALWDAQRPENYTGALHGKHLTPLYRGGRPVTLQISFRGLEDEECVRLKKTYSEVDKSENAHDDTLPIGLLHPLLFADFLEHRKQRLLRCGALPALASYDRARDRYAFFVSERSADRSAGGYCPLPADTITGRHSSTEPLSDAFGHALYRTAVEVLGRNTLPDWGSSEMRTQLRGLFKAHKGVRFLNGSYWGGIREDWAYAEWRTNDTMRTLKQHYSKPSANQRLAKERRVVGINNPHHFDALLDHLRAGGAVDFTALRLERPETGIVRAGEQKRSAA